MTTLFNSTNTNNISASSAHLSNGDSSRSNLTQQIENSLKSLAKDLDKTKVADSQNFSDRIAQIIKLANTIDQQEKIEQQKLAEIAEKLRLAKDTETLFAQTTKQISQLFKVERVLLYQFQSENQGIVAAETLKDGFTPAQGESISPLCFGLANTYYYQQAKVVAIANVEQAELSPYQRQLMERFQTKASLAIPVFVSGQVWGLLVTQQCLKTRQWQESEIRLLERLGTELGVQLQITNVKTELEKELKAQQALAKVIENLRQPFDLETLYKKAVQEVRKLLQSERVTIYQFQDNYSRGTFIVEAELAGFPKLVGSSWEDSYLHEHQGGRFRNDSNASYVCDDIHQSDLSECHIETLESFGIKSFAIVGIFKEKKLWGLLAAYQNTNARNWSQSEVELLGRIADQIGIALDQNDNLEQIKARNTELEIIAKQEKTSFRLIERIRQTLDLDTTLRITTKELRSLLNCDRVVLYQFNDDWSGRFVAESVTQGWTILLEQQDKIRSLQDGISDCRGIQGITANSSAFPDTYLQETQGGSFRERQLLVRDDIHQAGFSPCYLEVLEEYQAKAYAMTPVFVGDKLWGLLAAFQNTKPRRWQKGEVNLLTQVANQLGVALQQVQYVNELQKQSEQISQLAEQGVNFAKLIYQLGQQSPAQLQDISSLKNLLRLATAETRRLFKTDRVAIYQFNKDWSGDFVVEDFGKDWTALVGKSFQNLIDTYLQETQGGRYAQKESLRVDDIYSQGYHDCHIQLLEQFQAKAYMLAPIFKGEQLWGLLAAYHNREPRPWNDNELRLLTQVGSQIGVVIQRMEDIQELTRQRQKLTEAAEREKTDKERLQREALSLLRAVEPALKGNLTVKAPLWEDEVGTIADGYNTTLQTLRELVRQVKFSAEKVGRTCSDSNVAVHQLSTQAQRQSQELNQALQQLQQMVDLIAEVAINAQQVNWAVLEANQTVQTGDSVMEQTVAGIAEIRETVSETAKKLKNLGESSQKIAKVVRLIDNFANQTNLLAINAAIEATRAGEYGQGFAVVADEIRALAYQSANAGTEIERLVQEIRTETQSVTEAMELGIMRVVKGTELVNKTRQSLDEIKSATRQISDRVQQITDSTSTQAEQSQMMTKAMTDVAEIAKQTSSNSVDIATLFEDLLVTSEQLQNSISKFKID